MITKQDRANLLVEALERLSLATTSTIAWPQVQKAARDLLRCEAGRFPDCVRLAWRDLSREMEIAGEFGMLGPKQRDAILEFREQVAAQYQVAEVLGDTVESPDGERFTDGDGDEDLEDGDAFDGPRGGGSAA